MGKATEFEAFITRYALTDGIKRVRVQDCFHISQTMVKESANSLMMYHGKDWHRTEAEAIARAEEMRQAKLKSLRKSIANLEKLDFTPSTSASMTEPSA